MPYIRKPRSRAQNTRMAPPGSPGFSPVWKVEFSAKFWADIETALQGHPPELAAIKGAMRSGDEQAGPIVEQLQEIVGDFYRARDQGTASVSEARYSLDRLSKLARRATSSEAKAIEANALLGSLNDRASSLLDMQLRRLLRLDKTTNVPAWRYCVGDPDWPLVSAAACSAAAQVKRGPYADFDLAILAWQLLLVFEAVTGKPATFSTIPGGTNGTTEPNSAAACFVCACTRHIESKVPQTAVLHALSGLLADRAKTAQSV